MKERIAVTIDFTSCRYASELYRGMPYKGDDFTIIRPRIFRNIPYGQDRAFTEYADKICAISSGHCRRGDILSLSIKYVDDAADHLSDYSV